MTKKMTKKEFLSIHNRLFSSAPKYSGSERIFYNCFKEGKIDIKVWHQFVSDKLGTHNKERKKASKKLKKSQWFRLKCFLLQLPTSSFMYSPSQEINKWKKGTL